MINDEERRRVAKDIRWYVKVCKRPKWKTLCGIVLGDGDFNTAMMIRTLSRLADLIEPDPRDTTKTAADTTKTAADTTKCDREALLALADEMERAAPDYSLWEVCEGTERNITDEVADFARRIREACEGQKTPDASTDADRGTRVDRDALLALAAGLEADADRVIKAAKNARFGGGPRIEEAKHEASEWRSIARRIREALGVSDD